MWETKASVSYSYLALADMNGDATVDVVSPEHGGKLTFLNGANGKVLASHKIGSLRGWYGAAVFDVDRDGVMDVVPTGGTPYKLVLLKANMGIKKIIDLSPLVGEGFSLTSPGIFDLAGDGVPEIVLTSGNWTCASDTTG